MKGLRSIPRILKIMEIEGRKASLLFNNGQSKVIDVENFLHDNTEVKTGSLADQVLSNDSTFNTMEVIGTTIGWPGVGIKTKDASGNEVFYSFDLDPLMLFNAGEVDERYELEIGSQVKKMRKELGLTQQELAKRAGTTKQYISKLENRKSDIEILTLKKIVEAGLNKKLVVTID